MIPIIENNRAEIVALCQQYGIRKLDLFGSAAKGTFDPASSDLDFVVDLGEYERGVARRYLGFIVALERLLDHEVEVMTVNQVENPYFRAELEATAKTIYEAHDRTAVA